MKHAVTQIAVVLVAAITLAACSSVSYYSQAVSGQLSLLSKRRPIAEVLADPKTPPAVRARLQTVQRARNFASAELDLPDNASYRSYADLGRRYAVWNVFAAPELSLAPRQWCFPITGCVAYRGYFSRDAAVRFAKGLKDKGDDVEVEGITAYSTLGWFSDPVLNTMLRQPGYDLAALVFHELAHQELFVSGDTTFNESFATAVEEEGLRRWLLHEHKPEVFRKYRERKRRQARFIALVMRTRERLKDLYASPMNDEAKRAGKRGAFAELKQEYAKLKKSWGGYGGYDRWFDRELNNASLVPIGSYHDYVPAFEQLLRDCDGDLKRFYRQARRIGKLSPTERTRKIQELLGKFSSTAADGFGDRAPASATPLPPSPSA
jgi:predicted aminopeptidase